jgi:DNA-binding beta-propeller fold protein YncE
MAAILALVLIGFTGGGFVSSPAETTFVSETIFGSFDQASRITTGPDGRVYVVDTKRNAVVIFKSPQDVPTVLGGYGWTASTFDKPAGVATDGLNIYVADYGNHRIQRFDRYSNLLSSLLTRDTSYAPARFGYPAGVALSNQGDLIILDSENLRVVEFSADSRYERTFGDLNAAGGKLQDPIKICSEGDQYIYVLEKNGIIQFDFYGNFLRSFAKQLHGEIVGGQSTQNGIAAVCADTLYWFTADGSLGSQTPLRSLIAEEPVSSVQDIAFSGGHLFVLTPHRCHIFDMVLPHH